MSGPMAPAVTLDDAALAHVLAHYAARGWAAIRGAFGAPALDMLRARADDLMLGRVVHEGLFFQHDTTTGRYEDLTFGKGWQGPSLNYRKLEKLEKDPVFRALIANPLFERLARAQIDGPVTIYRAALMNKAAHGGTVLPWHQDGGVLWGLSRDPELQVWLALDDAPDDAGCVEIIPGTHRAGLATPLGGMIPAAITDAARADARAVVVPARAGDVLLIHNHVWHRSGVNRTAHPRRAVTICYMGADVRCMRKKNRPRAFTVAFP